MNLRVVAVGLWLVALTAIVVAVGPGRILAAYQQVTPEGIRDQIGAYGALTVLLFLAISVVRPLFLLPLTPFTLASGFLFGFWQGMLWSTVGTTLSAVLTFVLSRYLLHDFFRSRFYRHYEWIEKALEARGWRSVLFLRLIPLLPFDVVGLVAGVCTVKFSDYLVGTVAGELPGATVLVLLGSSMDQVGSPLFYVSLALALVVVAGPELARRLIGKRRGSIYR